MKHHHLYKLEGGVWVFCEAVDYWNWVQENTGSLELLDFLPNGSTYTDGESNWMLVTEYSSECPICCE